MLNFQKHQIIQYLFIFSPNILNIFVCRIICSPLVPAVPVNLLLKRRSKKWLTYLFYRLSSIYNFWKPPPHCREWIFKHRWKCPQTTAFSTHPCKKTKPWRWQSDKNLQTQIFTFPFISAIQQFWTDPACAGWKYVSQVVMGLVVQDVVEINFDSEYITLNIEFVLRWKVYSIFALVQIRQTRMSSWKSSLAWEILCLWGIFLGFGPQTSTYTDWRASKLGENLKISNRYITSLKSKKLKWTFWKITLGK